MDFKRNVFKGPSLNIMLAIKIFVNAFSQVKTVFF